MTFHILTSLIMLLVPIALFTRIILRAKGKEELGQNIAFTGILLSLIGLLTLLILEYNTH